MWYSYVAWHMHGGGQGDEEALKILSRAQVACPGKGDGSVYIEHISASIREGQQGKNLHIAALDAGCLMLGLLRTEILEKMGALDKAKVR